MNNEKYNINEYLPIFFSLNENFIKYAWSFYLFGHDINNDKLNNNINKDNDFENFLNDKLENVGIIFKKKFDLVYKFNIYLYKNENFKILNDEHNDDNHNDKIIIFKNIFISFKNNDEEYKILNCEKIEKFPCFYNIDFLNEKNDDKKKIKMSMIDIKNITSTTTTTTTETTTEQEKKIENISTSDILNIETNENINKNIINDIVGLYLIILYSNSLRNLKIRDSLNSSIIELESFLYCKRSLFLFKKIKTRDRLSYLLFIEMILSISRDEAPINYSNEIIKDDNLFNIYLETIEQENKIIGNNDENIIIKNIKNLYEGMITIGDPFFFSISYECLFVEINYPFEKEMIEILKKLYINKGRIFFTLRNRNILSCIFYFGMKFKLKKIIDEISKNNKIINSLIYICDNFLLKNIGGDDDNEDDKNNYHKNFINKKINYEYIIKTLDLTIKTEHKLLIDSLKYYEHNKWNMYHIYNNNNSIEIENLNDNKNNFINNNDNKKITTNKKSIKKEYKVIFLIRFLFCLDNKNFKEICKNDEDFKKSIIKIINKYEDSNFNEDIIINSNCDEYIKTLVDDFNEYYIISDPYNQFPYCVINALKNSLDINRMIFSVRSFIISFLDSKINNTCLLIYFVYVYIYKIKYIIGEQNLNKKINDVLEIITKIINYSDIDIIPLFIKKELVKVKNLNFIKINEEHDKKNKIYSYSCSHDTLLNLCPYSLIKPIEQNEYISNLKKDIVSIYKLKDIEDLYLLYELSSFSSSSLSSSTLSSSSSKNEFDNNNNIINLKNITNNDKFDETLRSRECCTNIKQYIKSKKGSKTYGNIKNHEKELIKNPLNFFYN